MKKIVAASLSAVGFLALAACTEGDPGAAPDQPPLQQTEPMATPPADDPAAPADPVN